MKPVDRYRVVFCVCGPSSIIHYAIAALLGALGVLGCIARRWAGVAEGTARVQWANGPVQARNRPVEVPPAEDHDATVQPVITIAAATGSCQRRTAKPVIRSTAAESTGTA